MTMDACKFQNNQNSKVVEFEVEQATAVYYEVEHPYFTNGHR